MNKTTWSLLTAQQQGAIAIIQLQGDVDPLLETLTGRTEWRGNQLHLHNIEDIDEVLCVKLSDTVAQIMPHGGLHIIRLFEKRFHELGIPHQDSAIFPEASSPLEADMVLALSRAASPLAVELLLAQPRLHQTTQPSNPKRDAALNHLIHPPTVVMLGEPNTGKSTLMNALTSEETSIVHDMPGVTRDAVGARVNCHGLVIHLYDLPGIRDSEDDIEQNAIALSTRLIDEADLILQIRDAESKWVECNATHVIRVGTKSDAINVEDADVLVSAHQNQGIQELASRIRQMLVPDEFLSLEIPWAFCESESD